MTTISEKKGVYMYKGVLIMKRDKTYSTTVRVQDSKGKDRLVTISSDSQDSICKYLNENKGGKIC